MKFDWDENKNRINISRRRINFVDVPPVFDGPMLVELDRREDYGEERLIGIGFLWNRVVVVVFTEPDDDTTRIISVRKANKYERSKLEQWLAE